VVSGPDLTVNKAYADKINARLKQIHSLRDLQYVQALDYPRIMIDIDRERAGFAGISVADAANSMIAATFSSRYVLPVFWADPRTGIGYQVQVEVPPAHVNSIGEIERIPLKKLTDGSTNGGGQLEMRDIATVRKETMPEEYDRLNQLRYISQTANIDGEDLGRVNAQINEALKALRFELTDEKLVNLKQPAGWRKWVSENTPIHFSGLADPVIEGLKQKLKPMINKEYPTEDAFEKELATHLTAEEMNSYKERLVSEADSPPRGVQVEVRGQVPPMNQMFSGLATGLVLAVIMVLLLLTAYFQSIRLAVVASATAPAVVAGVLTALYLTGTTLNIESFMGAIMAIGVAVANAILLVTFAERNRQTGMSSTEAAVHGASERLRPILMTSCAMIAGMFPMALGYGEGGEQTAALGRAVIGGLLFATGATLLILPHVFAVVLGKSEARSPSLHPADADSKHYDPTGGADQPPHHGHHDAGAAHGGHVAHGEAPPADEGEGHPTRPEDVIPPTDRTDGLHPPRPDAGPPPASFDGGTEPTH
jgi:multidrug efflux pump subunit AcrB